MEKRIINGSKMVIINNQNTAKIYESRLFVDNGNVAGFAHATHKTLKVAEKWAKKILGI